MKTTLAFASRTSRSTTAWIWLNSSSYITIWGLTITPPAALPTFWQLLPRVVCRLGHRSGPCFRDQNLSPLLAKQLFTHRFLLYGEEHFYLTPLGRTRVTECG